MERKLIQYVAGTLAGSAFIATTQILTGVPLDVPLYVALVAFAINIPFQILIFLMPVRSIRETKRLCETSQSWSWTLYLLALVFSTPFIIIGFTAMFCHFAWWLGVLFALAAWAAYEIYRRSALENFKQRPDEYE
jgi:hypothetical protein